MNIKRFVDRTYDAIESRRVTLTILNLQLEIHEEIIDDRKAREIQRYCLPRWRDLRSTDTLADLEHRQIVKPLGFEIPGKSRMG